MTLLGTTMETRRLTLRCLDEGDAPAVFSIFSSEEVARYWSRPAMKEHREAEEWLAKSIASYHTGEGLQLGLVRREDRALIGTCTLWAIDTRSRRAEVGFALARGCWGQGYMREALAAIVAHGFGVLDLNRLEADTDPRNAASIKVLEHIGFVREGYMRERWIVNDEVCDTIFYGLLRREYEAARAASTATTAAPTT